MKIREMARRCEAMVRDPELKAVADWKAAHPGRKARSIRCMLQSFASKTIAIGI